MSDTERDELVALLLKHGHVEWDEFDASTVADALLDFLAARDARVKAEAVEALAERTGEMPGDSYNQAKWLRARAAELREGTK